MMVTRMRNDRLLYDVERQRRAIERKYNAQRRDLAMNPAGPALSTLPSDCEARYNAHLAAARETLRRSRGQERR